jgi:hypothetical protein
VKHKTTKRKHGRAQLPSLTEESDFAQEIGLAEATLSKKRKRGEGGGCLRIGRRIYYTPEHKAQWLAYFERQTTQQSRRAFRRKSQAEVRL